MNDYIVFLWEADAAKRRLGELFESETAGPTDRLTAIVDRGRSRAALTGVDKNNNLFREYHCTRTPVCGGTRTAIPTTVLNRPKRDLTVSSFVLALVLVSVVLAGHTDQPVFWLLIGPTPLAVLHTIRAFLRQRVVRREGLLTFSDRNR